VSLYFKRAVSEISSLSRRVSSEKDRARRVKLSETLCASKKAAIERRDSSTREIERNEVAVPHQRVYDVQRVMRLSRPRVRSGREHSECIR